jgi:hypothetical protein
MSRAGWRELPGLSADLCGGLDCVSSDANALIEILAHEVMHPALHHHVRRSGRDPRLWNRACDFGINPLLVDAGFSLPDGVLIDNRLRGMNREQIYNLLESESESEQDPSREIGDNEPRGKRSNGWRNRRGIQLQHGELWKELIEFCKAAFYPMEVDQCHNRHCNLARADELAYEGAPPDFPLILLAHSLHTCRRTTSQNSQSDGLSWLMPDQQSLCPRYVRFQKSDVRWHISGACLVQTAYRVDHRSYAVGSLQSRQRRPYDERKETATQE